MVMCKLNYNRNECRRPDNLACTDKICYGAGNSTIGENKLMNDEKSFSGARVYPVSSRSVEHLFDWVPEGTMVYYSFIDLCSW